MAQKKRKKKPTPHMDKMALRESLRDKLTDAEIEELEREIRASIQHGIDAYTEQQVQAAYLRHWAVTMRVLIDRFAWEKDDIIKLWNASMEYLDDIKDGLITPEEMLSVLERDDDITMDITMEGL